jgi:hypothetical protein
MPEAERARRPLFVTWDGPQVSYLEGLFVPIFKALAAYGHVFHVLQFTWGDLDRVAAARNACEAEGIPFRSAPVWRRPPGIGPFAAALSGGRHIRRAMMDWRIDTLMPRSLMPALSTLASRGRDRTPVLFDADGFAADERVDFGGLSPRSWTYRALRNVEARMVRASDGVLVRSPAAIPILIARAGAATSRDKFTVVSNGRDPAPFAIDTRGRHMQTDGSHRDFKLCYLGSVGEQYCPERMLSVAIFLKRRLPNLTFQVFTGDEARFRDYMKDHPDTDLSWITVRRLPHDRVAEALLNCDLALALRKPAFSTQGISPIKLGDYLLAGLPVIGTPGVGNVAPLIADGVFHPDDGDLERMATWVQTKVIPQREAMRTLCQRLGVQLFSIEHTARQYNRALDQLSAGR